MGATMRTRVSWLGCAIVSLTVLSAGCADGGFSGGAGGSDGDGDGWGSDIDCNDQDPEVNPAAEERVNCKDDDCDGEVDEGTANADSDGDGHCPMHGDCDESNPLRNYSMAEDGGDGSGRPNGIDDNCNGIIDEGLPGSDTDNDGYSRLDGDCNDRDPYINPGAVEVEGMTCRGNAECPFGKCYGGYCRCLADGDCSSSSACSDDTDCKFAGETCKNGACTTTFKCRPPVTEMREPTLKVCRDETDNDCDGEVDELPVACDAPDSLEPGNALDFARAMELCDTHLACGQGSACPGNLRCVKNKCTRVLSATFNAESMKKQRDIASDFARGGPFTPRVGESFVVLSTGVARYDPTSNATCPQGGTEIGSTSADPDPKAMDRRANDLVELALEIAVPTNARSFEFDFQFFSAEYPEYVGSPFNDTFWVHLESKMLPPGNISFDRYGTPIRINNAFFSVCQPFPTKPQTLKMCTKPPSMLDGTGYGQGECAKGLIGEFGVPNGGSTDWLHTTAPVTPGETITLRFIIFDKGDSILDSAVLIDNFRWKLTPATRPMTGPD